MAENILEDLLWDFYLFGAIWRKPTKNALKRGLNWLSEHVDSSYQSLWVCKCLYAPELIIRSLVPFP